MRTREHRIAERGLALGVAVLLLLPAVMAVAGCGGSTPEAAVQDFFNAWQANDWEAYKDTVNPARKLTKEQEELARQKFQQIKVKFTDLKMSSKYSDKDKTKAVVTINDGKITYTADILGQKKTSTQDLSKDDPKTRPVYDVVLVNGKWYVDTSLG